MIQATRLPIVLCCAEESEVALVAVVDALHREGYAPEVVPGVETDATLLGSAADRVRGPALFVLCQSDDLDRFQVRRLEGLFSARKGPAHRMVSVEVARRGAAAIVSEVRVAAREVGRSMGHRDDDDGSYMRDVVIPTSVAAVPGASVPDRRSDRGAAVPGGAGPAAIVQAPEGISDEALGLDAGHDGADTEVVDPFELHRRARLPEPDLQLTTDPAARAALESESWPTDDRPSDGVPLAVPDDYPVVGESSPDVAVRGAPRRASWAESGPVDVERVARRKKADPRAESDDRPLPSASTPIELGRAAPTVAAEAPPPERKGARILLLLFAGAGMGAVVTMAVLHATAPAGPRPDDVHERGVPRSVLPAAEPTPKAKVVPPPEPRPPVEASAEAQPGAREAAAGPVEGAIEDAGPAEGAIEDAGPAEDGADAVGSVEDDADEAGPANDEAEAEPGRAEGDEPVGKLVPPPPRTTAGDAALAAALAEGRVRELGELLVNATGPSTVTWDEAASRCRRRKVGGVGNWRLPTKGQLDELRRAKLLAPGTYWSRSTVGDDEAVVVDAGSGEASPWLKMEPNGRVVCVRPRP